MMLIPWESLSPETLNNILESFVLREGTDYGEVEKTLTEKVNELKAQLKDKKIAIYWSELHESINIQHL